MKLFARLTLLTLILFAAPAITSCKQKPSTPEHLKENIDRSGKEYNSAYICPMHCEGSGSEEPGVCPVCGMDYVKNGSAGGN